MTLPDGTARIRSEPRLRVPATDAELTAYYQGAYDQCRRLLTSPRMNRPQREIIESEAWALKRELESRGVRFVEESG